MLNYRQLYYFWTVARAGGIARAAEQLHLTPQTLSGQVAQLEESLGVQLFRRAGRRLELTEAGRQTLPYAEDIFQMGGELEEHLRNRQEVFFFLLLFLVSSCLNLPVLIPFSFSYILFSSSCFSPPLNLPAFISFNFLLSPSLPLFFS